MKRFGLIATILVVAASCDKARQVVSDARGEPAATGVPEQRLDLAAKPEVLFQVFGERDDPRMIPVAAVVNGALVPISLSASGWRQFDAMYARAGETYALYRDGAPAGRMRVRRGMWETGAEPLYSLPGCAQLIPLAAVTIDASAPRSFTVEYLATTAGLVPRGRPRPSTSAALSRRARDLAYTVAAQSGVPRSALSDSAFQATAIASGATVAPTVVASFLDGTASSAENGSAHVFMLADSTSGGYAPTFRHVAPAASSDAEFRRYVNHIDINGDGVDEVLLEGWRWGGDTFVIGLSFRDGEWTETFRGRPSWCLDAPSGSKQ